MKKFYNVRFVEDCLPIKNFYSGKGRFAYFADANHKVHNGLYYSRPMWEKILKAVFKLKKGDVIYNNFLGENDIVNKVYFERCLLGNGCKSWFVNDFFVETKSHYYLYHYPYKNRRDYDADFEVRYRQIFGYETNYCFRAAKKLLTNKVHPRKSFALYSD